MGLDNIPHTYPCKTQGTVVTVKMIDQRTGDIFIDENGETVDQIDCDQTMACGGCPWKKALGDLPGAVYGIFGTPCWYRGKYGHSMLNALGIDAEVLYSGTGEDGLITPNDARELANRMNDAYSDDGEARHTVIMWGDENVADEFWYLHDWLIWTALECEGVDAWY